MSRMGRPPRDRLLPGVKTRGLFANLFLSHLYIASLGALMLVTALMATVILKNRVYEAVMDTVPVNEAAADAVDWVHEATLALRNWVVIKDPASHDRWEDAWERGISPAAERLGGLLGGNGGGAGMRMGELRQTLSDLKEAQWWVQDIMHSGGAEPARVLYDSRIRPVSAGIARCITSLIDLEREKDRAEINPFALAVMADFRFHFANADGNLYRFIDSGEGVHLSRMRENLGMVGGAYGELAGAPGLSRRQQTLVKEMGNLLELFGKDAAEAEAIRKSDEWNVAISMMSSETAPLSEAALKRLSSLRQLSYTAEEISLEKALNVAEGAVWLFAVFLVMMAVVSFFVAERGARRIATPVNMLLDAAQRMGRREKIEDLKPRGDREIARLIEEFNGMRRALERGQTALVESERRYRALMEQAGDAILIATPEGVLIDANRAAENLLGRSRAKIVGMSILDIHTEDSVEYVAEKFSRLWETGQVRAESAVIVRKDGLHTPVSITGSIVRYGGTRFAMGIFRDITEVVAAHEKLREQGWALNEAERIAGLGSWDWHISSNTLSWSDQAYRICGYRPQEVQPSYDFFMNLVHPDDRAEVEEEVGLALAGHKPYLIEHRIIRPDGDIRYVLERGESLRDKKGAPYRMIGIIHDITDRIQRQELELVARGLERTNKTLKEFTSIASHDLQSPLMTIIGFSDRVLKQHGDQLDEKGMDYMRRVHSSAVRMRELIRGLLEYSNVSDTESKAERVGMNGIIGEIVSDLTVSIEKSGATLEVDPLPEVYGDRTLIRQAFQNLIGNALKYSKPDTPPVIRVFHDKGKDRSEYSYVAITVADNGIGFGQEYAESIFHVFHRLHNSSAYSGSGIGLATAKKIVERHGGLITATGEPGRGARFTALLPAAPASVDLDLQDEGA